MRRAIIEQALPPGAQTAGRSDRRAFRHEPHAGSQRRLGACIAEGLVDAQPKRTVTVAQPSLEEARDVFEARRALEREVVALVVERWRPEYGAELEGHVREENAAAARRDDRVSIRLAGEFHVKLAAMSGNRVLERYLGELVSRCSLILALYGRPHSSECAVNEHSAIHRGDPTTAMRGRRGELMRSHVDAVEGRALLRRGADAEADLGAVLSRYAEAVEAPRRAIALKRRRKGA